MTRRLYVALVPWLGLLILEAGLYLSPAVSAAPASSCQPPAQSWATLVACKSQTANAVTATAAGVQAVTEIVATRTPQPSFTTVLIPSATLVPSATWTPQPTPPALLIDSDGNPYTCDSLTPAPWLLLRPDGTWRGCVRVPTLPAATRIQVTP
jgi:hypothetical protein